MTNQAISHKEVSALCDDISYLQDEAEALKYLIDRVPYDEEPPDGYSIIDLLKLIDYSQHHYYRPVTEKVLSDKRLVKLNEFEEPESGFKEYNSDSENGSSDIQRVLSKIVKHRAAFLNIVDKISLFEWEKTILNKNNKEVTLFEFISEMIRKERGRLKKVADLVLIYQNEKEHQREIEKRSSHRNFNNS